jgi:hypothetical protein
LVEGWGEEGRGEGRMDVQGGPAAPAHGKEEAAFADDALAWAGA